MAEEVGVEPTDHFYSSPLVLKTRRPTGDNALPELILAGVSRRSMSGVQGASAVGGLR